MNAFSTEDLVSAFGEQVARSIDDLNAINPQVQQHIAGNSENQKQTDTIVQQILNRVNKQDIFMGLPKESQEELKFIIATLRQSPMLIPLTHSFVQKVVGSVQKSVSSTMERYEKALAGANGGTGEDASKSKVARGL